MRFRRLIDMARLVVLLLLVNGFCYAEHNNKLSGYQNPFKEALERTTTVSEKTFKDSRISGHTNYLVFFSPQIKNNAIDKRKSQPRLKHNQTSTIDAVLATGEFVSSGTELIVHPHHDS